MSSGHLTHLTHSTMTAGLTPKMSTMRRRAAFMRTVPVGRTPTSTHTAQAATIIHPTRWYAKSQTPIRATAPMEAPLRPVTRVQPIMPTSARHALASSTSMAATVTHGLRIVQRARPRHRHRATRKTACVQPIRATAPAVVLQQLELLALSMAMSYAEHVMRGLGLCPETRAVKSARIIPIRSTTSLTTTLLAGSTRLASLDSGSSSPPARAKIAAWRVPRENIS